jgi:CheY-like chemotaxis protein
MLAVSDNGVGMTRETIEKIFDPFYTTKPVGKGTGLGLSMVQGFVKQSQGAIRVYSEPGVGTSFKLYFPVAPDAAIAAHIPLAQSARSADDKMASGRILLVEDQVEVMEVLRQILEVSGYDVVTATSGDEAHRLFARDDQFDLVATDIVMPGELQGPSLAAAIREIRPDMRFIFLSGYASEATVHGNGLRAEDIRLMKPISRGALLTAIEKSLTTAR